MAIVHTKNLPKHKGELEVARQIRSLNDTKLHAWFSLDFIPGVRDIDLLLIHENIGAFVIEIKAVPLKAIKLIGHQVCEIEGRARDKGPTVQAYNAMQSLRNYLKQKMSKMPFFIATACWPRIGRATWNRNWDDDEVKAPWSDGLLYEEDIFTPEVLRDRLQEIARNPPIRSGASIQGVSKDQIELLDRALSVEARPKPTATDYARLKAIESGVKKQTKKEFPFGETKKVVFTGHPGTGKTFRLIQIGLGHAYEGGKVLYACFNKTLASDIRRLLSFHDGLKSSINSFDVSDVYQIAAETAAALDFTYEETDDHDEWGGLVLEGVIDSEDGEIYDTLLVDEAQDMQDWQLGLLEYLAKKTATICLAVGRGQELYDDSAHPKKWLKAFQESGARIVNLRRNFRNTAPGFMFSRCFYEAFPNVDKIDGCLKAYENKQLEIELQRDRGGVPRKVLLDETDVPDYDDPRFPQLQHDMMVKSCFEVIESEYSRLGENEEPIDMLILVPDTKGTYRDWVTEALKRFTQQIGIGYIDYVDDRNRRDIGNNSQIRLVTFHSSRGLEGVRVLVFGSETLQNLSNKIGFNVNKLSYIVFSRALIDTTVVMRSSISNSITFFSDKALTKILKIGK